MPKKRNKRKNKNQKALAKARHQTQQAPAVDVGIQETAVSGQHPGTSADVENDAVVDEIVTEGIAKYQAGLLDQALEIFRHVVETAPSRADGYSLTGVVHLAKGEVGPAAENFRKAISRDPNMPDYRFNLALACLAMDELDDAADAARGAIALNPEYPEAWNTLGTIFNAKEDWASARNAFEKSVQYNPDYATGWTNLGGAAQELGSPEEGIEFAKKALDLDPNLAQAYYNLAHCHDELGEHEDSISNLLRCIELDPEYTNSYANLCRSYALSGDLEEAKKMGEISLQKDPNNPSGIINLGLALHGQAEFQAAVELYLRAVAIDPKSIHGHNNLAHVYLAREEFHHGWEEFEWGYVTKHRVLVDSPVPVWAGEPVAGKHLQIVGEQAVGEQIMFSTFIPDLLDEGARITYECESRLAPLIARSFPELTVAPLTVPPDPIIENGEFDYKTAIGSIARWYRTKVTDFKPKGQFLVPDPTIKQECRDRYTALGPGPVIGISWKSKTPRHSDRKNITLEHWKPIFDAAPNATFVSVQYGEVEDDIEFAREKMGIEIYNDPHISALDSIEQSAAQIAAVDIVVSISNATVHLSGGLGIPTLTMVGAVPLWHWFLNREDSLWYQSIRLFRRAIDEDWDKVTDRVSKALANALASDA